MRITLYYNKNAGSGVSIQSLRRDVEAGGHELVQIVSKDDDLGSSLDASSTELLVVAGGDGTVSRAADALVGRATSLTILPVGTANNIATSLGIEGSVLQLSRGWSTGHRLAIDIGVAGTSLGERRFLEAVGVGWIPTSIAAMKSDSGSEEGDRDSKLARAIHRYRDVLARLKPRRWRLTLDGTRLDDDFLLVEVLNTRSIGPNLVLSTDVDPSDGFFSVATATEKHRKELDDYLSGRIERTVCDLTLPTWRAREIEIEGWDPLHVDDEVQQSASIETTSIRVEPSALQFLVQRAGQTAYPSSAARRARGGLV
jgi:diacylglycerol kinase (ATP)